MITFRYLIYNLVLACGHRLSNFSILHENELVLLEKERALVLVEEELELVEVELGSVEGPRVLNLVERERKLDQVWGEME